jgi:hypothetical protein
MRQSIFECEQARLCELGVVDEVFSGDVAVAAEAPMYDVEWRESNAEGGDPLQNDAATLL